MKKIAVIPNTTKDENYIGTNTVINMIKESGNIPLMCDIDKNCGIDTIFVSKEELKTADMIVVLGGDGTLLSAARDFFDCDIPILGINHGHLGFLTEVEKNDEKTFKEILKGNYTIAKHTTLSVQVGDKSFKALNDATIHRGGFSRMLEICIYIDKQIVNSFSADGLIIATPTGSTAYSLSAGGPIVDPTVEVLIITPICPHNLYSRSIIVPIDKEIEIVLKDAEKRDAMLTLDGQIGVKLENNESLIISGSGKVNLVRKNNSSFYKKLRKKMFEKEI